MSRAVDFEDRAIAVFAWAFLSRLSLCLGFAIGNVAICVVAYIKG